MNCSRIVSIVLPIIASLPIPAFAHEGHSHFGHSHHEKPTDGQTHAVRPAVQEAVRAVNTRPEYVLVMFQTKEGKLKQENKPGIAVHFDKFKNVKTRWDDKTLFVESNGLPDHDMMVGIRSWQQQVPLPQPFTGSNAWQIPLHPKLADKPISAKTNLYRGAIALAVNGVPIFNALNNRGEDAMAAGELDKWGGHCGRGDDYHYHAAPVHLEEIVGKGNPIAFALDGFPIYGLTEADGSPVGQLDEFNGQFDADGQYHYHATKTYPYINGGMRGVVTVRGDQVEPQPRDAPVRPALQPLRGATITDFKTTGKQSVLTYTLRGKKGTVAYSPVNESSWKFTYTEPGGQSRTQTYQRNSRQDDRGGRRPPRDNNRPPRR
ncbi:MAG: hypothetical protein Aurels2KO_47240 [Aureliella sp.]